MCIFIYLTSGNETCYDLSLLSLKSESKGFCVSASTNDATLTQISVRLLVDGINHQYFPHCGIVGALPQDSTHEFSCALEFNELKEVEFIISGYNASINDEWRSKVQLSITHHCTDPEGR